MVVFEAELVLGRQVVTHAQGDAGTGLVRRRFRIEEAPGQQTLEAVLRRHIVVGMGLAHRHFAKHMQHACAHILVRAHEAGTQPVDVAQVSLAGGVAKVGVVHGGRIEDVRATVPLQPDAQRIGIDRYHRNADHVGVGQRIASNIAVTTLETATITKLGIGAWQ